MMLFYRVSVFPFGQPTNAEDWYKAYNPLEFELSLSHDLDDFIRIWFDNYHDAYIIVEAVKEELD